MTRERAPYRQEIDLDELSAADWKHYAHACGRALALANARSDEAGKIDYDVEPHILDAMQPFPLFMDDITEFACDAAKRGCAPTTGIIGATTRLGRSRSYRSTIGNETTPPHELPDHCGANRRSGATALRQGERLRAAASSPRATLRRAATV